MINLQANVDDSIMRRGNKKAKHKKVSKKTRRRCSGAFLPSHPRVFYPHLSSEFLALLSIGSVCVCVDCVKDTKIPNKISGICGGLNVGGSSRCDTEKNSPNSVSRSR